MGGEMTNSDIINVIHQWDCPFINYPNDIIETCNNPDGPEFCGKDFSIPRSCPLRKRKYIIQMVSEK